MISPYQQPHETQNKTHSLYSRHLAAVCYLHKATARKCSATTTDSLLHHHQPDSALQLLFNIKDETSLPEAERMKLVWNKAMAHYQMEMSLLEDSLLYQAIAYYRQQPTDTARLLDTYLLEGMYLRWKEANDEAITVFDKGIALAISRKTPPTC